MRFVLMPCHLDERETTRLRSIYFLCLGGFGYRSTYGPSETIEDKLQRRTSPVWSCYLIKISEFRR